MVAGLHACRPGLLGVVWRPWVGLGARWLGSDAQGGPCAAGSLVAVANVTLGRAGHWSARPGPPSNALVQGEERMWLWSSQHVRWARPC